MSGKGADPVSAHLPAEHGTALVPVTVKDPSWGRPDAPVTIVEFSDFQCPFCARAASTLEKLKNKYGPEKLRLVWKNLPLPFHDNARPAQEAAMAVFALAGNEGFWKFHDKAMSNQQDLKPENYLRWAVEAGVDGPRFQQEITAGQQAAKLDEDLALAERLNIQGTPNFRINGLTLTGAQPIEKFEELIDEQLNAAKLARAAGITAELLYPVLCEKNAEIASPNKPAEKEDNTVWRVSVDQKDPARGPTDALVTLVVFSDFQCPFCQRLEKTLSALLTKYEPDLRIVWKDSPLAFHARAVPAAVLARVALEKKGVAGFWQAHDAIFDNQTDLSDEALAALAKKLGLPWTEVEKAIRQHRFARGLEASAKLATGVGVGGTPTVFVNGRKMEGALPVEAFIPVIDAQLAKARALVAAGQGRAGLYQAIVKAGEFREVAGPERKLVAQPTKDNPSKGNPRAPVTVQIFSDFQCPFCQKVNPTLAEIQKRFPGRVRFVWRNLPLPFHSHAALAAEAAQEVFAQKGAPGFWKYHDALFASQGESGLERGKLEKLAKHLGVDMKRFGEALDSHKHKAVVDADIAAATKADINGTPGFLINGYFVAGAQPITAFESVITRALKEAAAGNPKK
ncbi:MAG TPA: thioredoxin domain-containing protein [Polyangia bacterium]